MKKLLFLLLIPLSFTAVKGQDAQAYYNYFYNNYAKYINDRISTAKRNHITITDLNFYKDLYCTAVADSNQTVQDSCLANVNRILGTSYTGLTCPAGGSGGGSPAGNVGNVQYNSGGAFAGDDDFEFGGDTVYIVKYLTFRGNPFDSTKTGSTIATAEWVLNQGYGTTSMVAGSNIVITNDTVINVDLSGSVTNGVAINKGDTVAAYVYFTHSGTSFLMSTDGSGAIDSDVRGYADSVMFSHTESNNNHKFILDANGLRLWHQDLNYAGNLWSVVISAGDKALMTVDNVTVNDTITINGSQIYTKANEITFKDATSGEKSLSDLVNSLNLDLSAQVDSGVLFNRADTVSSQAGFTYSDDQDKLLVTNMAATDMVVSTATISNGLEVDSIQINEDVLLKWNITGDSVAFVGIPAGTLTRLDTAQLIPAEAGMEEKLNPFLLFFLKAKKVKTLPYPYPDLKPRWKINAVFSSFQFQYTDETLLRYMFRQWVVIWLLVIFIIADKIWLRFRR